MASPVVLPKSAIRIRSLAASAWLGSAQLPDRRCPPRPGRSAAIVRHEKPSRAGAGVAAAAAHSRATLSVATDGHALPLATGTAHRRGRERQPPESEARLRLAQVDRQIRRALIALSRSLSMALAMTRSSVGRHVGIQGPRAAWACGSGCRRRSPPSSRPRTPAGRSPSRRGPGRARRCRCGRRGPGRAPARATCRRWCRACDPAPVRLPSSASWRPLVSPSAPTRRRLGQPEVENLRRCPRS